MKYKEYRCNRCKELFKTKRRYKIHSLKICNKCIRYKGNITGHYSLSMKELFLKNGINVYVNGER